MANQRFIMLRRLHGRLHDYMVELAKRNTDKKLVKQGYDVSLKQSFEETISKEEYPVDFVVLWVDGNDPNWIAERKQYINTEEAERNNTEARWREWDNFQYWFRAVEKYAPWVRYVFFVTWGHVPSWLNTKHPKLRIIRHEEFIPYEYLPTFNTSTIELNIWRIPGLSEHFVYFNDDMFLMNPISISDFYHKGLPKYCAIAKPNFPSANMTTWEHQQFNAAGVVNTMFDVKESIKKHPEKWFSCKYKDDIKFNIRAYEDNKITGMLYSHLGAPCRISTMKEIWESVEEYLNETCKHKYRTMGDLIFQLYELWEMCKGTFEPVERDYYGFAGNILPDNFERFSSLIMSENIRMICINDSEQLNSDDFETIKHRLSETLSTKFPHKSSYEI